MLTTTWKAARAAAQGTFFAKILTVAIAAALAGCGGGSEAPESASQPQSAVIPTAQQSAVDAQQPEVAALEPQSAALSFADRKGSAAAAAPAPQSPLPRIGVRKVSGKQEFFDRTTGLTFTPQGYNYIKLATMTGVYGGTQVSHSTFNAGLYDAAGAETALTQMQALGYNTVRVFLSVCCIGTISQTTGGLDPQYIANVADFTRRAKAHNLAVIITSDGWLPPGYTGTPTAQDAPFQMTNYVYLSRAGLAGTQAYWRDFVTGLVKSNAALDNVLAFSIANEAFADTAWGPFNMKAKVTAANGKVYDMTNSTQRSAMVADGLVFFANEVTKQIRTVLPNAQVTMGFFTPNSPNVFAPGDTRIVPTLFPAFDNTALTYIDLHLYSAWGLTFQQQSQNLGIASAGNRPLLVMGEFGELHSQAQTSADAATRLDDWRAGSCALGFKGWLMWTWNTVDQDAGAWWTANGTDDTIAQRLAPKTHGAVCKS